MYILEEWCTKEKNMSGQKSTEGSDPKWPIVVVDDDDSGQKSTEGSDPEWPIVVDDSPEKNEVDIQRLLISLENDDDDGGTLPPPFDLGPGIAAAAAAPAAAAAAAAPAAVSNLKRDRESPPKKGSRKKAVAQKKPSKQRKPRKIIKNPIYGSRYLSAVNEADEARQEAAQKFYEESGDAETFEFGEVGSETKKSFLNFLAIVKLFDIIQRSREYWKKLDDMEFITIPEGLYEHKTLIDAYDNLKAEEIYSGSSWEIMTHAFGGAHDVQTFMDVPRDLYRGSMDAIKIKCKISKNYIDITMPEINACLERFSDSELIDLLKHEIEGRASSRCERIGEWKKDLENGNVKTRMRSWLSIFWFFLRPFQEILPGVRKLIFDALDRMEIEDREVIIPRFVDLMNDLVVISQTPSGRFLE